VHYLDQQLVQPVGKLIHQPLGLVSIPSAAREGKQADHGREEEVCIQRECGHDHRVGAVGRQRTQEDM